MTGGVLIIARLWAMTIVNDTQTAPSIGVLRLAGIVS